MPYPVFTSYAQADRERYLERFVKEFRDELRALTGGMDSVAMAFFDRDGVEAGDELTPVIINEANTADVLVCLMSPTYFRREWCGRELEIFLRRYKRLQPPGSNGRFIFPIWWQPPAVPRPLPGPLDRFDHQDANYPESYKNLGVRGLARRSLWTQFRQMAHGLAHAIAATLAEPQRLPPGEVIADIQRIPNAFDEQQPYDVKLVSLVAGGDGWRPTITDGTIAEAAKSAAERLQIFIREMDTGAGLSARLQEAQNQRQVILLLVDAAAAINDAVRSINQLDLPNLAVLLVDVANPPLGADVWIEQLPPANFAKKRDNGVLRIAGPGELRSQFERIVDETRRRLQAEAPTAKATDSALTDKARQQGISTETQPNLTGPGNNR